MGALWNELKNLRQYWNIKKFLQALIFGLLFTLLDTGTDFDFANAIPDDDFASKGVKFFTYTFIALPGVMLSFSALQSLVREWWKRNCGSEVPGWLRALLNAAALFLQMSFCTGLLIVPFSLTRAQLSDPASAPIIQGYEITINIIFEGSRHPNFMNPFEYGQSFIGKSFPKRIGTLTPPNPKILRGGTMCPPRYLIPQNRPG